MEEQKRWKWVKTYNLILRLMYYQEKEEEEIIEQLNNDYADYLANKGLDPKNEEVKFVEADFYLTLAFMQLVRTKEFIENELTKKDSDQVFDFSTWSKINVTSFDDLKAKFDINLKSLITEESKPSDKTKLECLFHRLRNSISHFNYIDEGEELKFFNKNKKGNYILDCQISRKDFLNLSIDFGKLTNDFIRINYAE
jgi:hypothetical protein